MKIRIIMATIVLVLGCGELAVAGVASALVRETYEKVVRTFAKEAAEEGLEKVAQNLDTLAARYGDDALEACRKVGPKAFRVVEEAGPQGLQAVKLMAKHGDDALWVVTKPNRMALFARYGDDAAEAMIRQGEVAEPVITAFGKSAATAFKSVSTQNGRRLAMMADDGALAKIGQTDELLGVVGKYGDRAMNFIWNNKAALAVGAGLTAFLANPQAFIDGTLDLTKVVADGTIRPLAEGFAGTVDWTVLSIVIVAFVSLGLAWRSYRRHRLAMRQAAM